MLLSLLLACNPDVTDSAAAGPVVTESCSEIIDIPTGLLEDSSAEPDPHQDTLGSDPVPVRIRYQWPEEDTSASAAFLWNTDPDTLASAVEIGPAAGFPADAVRYEGASFLFGSGVVGEGFFRIHEVKLCQRLTPGTTYSYRVGGEGAWSETFTFSTPEPTTDTFRVGVTGDSRGAYETWGQIVAAMDTAEVDLILFSGDMVELGSNQLEWNDWFDAAGDVLARRPLVPTHGNHEFLSQNYFAQFSMPGNEEWFALRYGDLHLVSLNDTVRDADQLASEQAAFIDETFTRSGDSWKIALHHQSAFSTCTTHRSDLDVRAAWVPQFDAHEVHAVFAGHNHIYERSLPIRGGAAVPAGEGTVYLVTGGAGAPLYDGVEEDWFSDVATPTNHYLIADFSPSSIDVEVFDLSGNTIDTFSVPR